MSKRLTFTLLTLLLTTGAQAQTIPADVAERAIALREEALNDTIAYELVESLTQRVGPRLAGTAGDKAAVKWAVATLESLGFKHVHTEAVEVPHWDRGSLDLRLTAPYVQTLVATSLGGSPGTTEAGVEGDIVRVESLQELRALDRDDLAGKIAYVDHRMERARDGAGYKTASRIRTCAHYVAADRGATAILIRSAGTSHHRFAHTGSLMGETERARIPAVALANADAEILTYAIGGGEPVTVRLRSTARYLPNETSANVVGEVRGQLSDEVVILGAHLDSWDLGTGAIDDGSGVAMMIATAKKIMDSGSKPRRTLRVILYANEEFGLSGARWYADHHAKRIDNHILGMEADFGVGRVWSFASRVPENKLTLIDELHALLAPLGIVRGDNKADGGADLGPLRKLGMPVLSMSQDGTKYFDYHHTADDTLDKIDVDDLNQNVAAYLTAAYVAANIEDDFGRLPVDTSERNCAPEFD